jgi:hypothetical protein
MVLAEIESEHAWTTPEELVRSRYSWRCLEGFAFFFGLVDVEREEKDAFDRSFRLKKAAVLDNALTFKV